MTLRLLIKLAKNHEGILKRKKKKPQCHTYTFKKKGLMFWGSLCLVCLKLQGPFKDAEGIYKHPVSENGIKIY